MSSAPKDTAGAALLDARGIVKEYTDGPRTITVLSGTDLHIRRAESLAVRGKSGAGKSTLLHILGLIDSPTRGQLLLEGNDVAAADAATRAHLRNMRFGFVFQAYHLIPELSALENIVLPAMMKGVLAWAGDRPRAMERARWLLSEVGLEARADHRPQKLSGGERQRVAIARSLINEPDVLFCDEPTGNLDEETSRSIIDLLLRLKKERGLTEVIVTHDRDLAAQADRIVRIEGGKIVDTSAR
jgi:lipoprotein-releasing system ATP-binding protein